MQRGLQRRSQRGKPDVVRVGDKQGAWEEGGDQLCSWLQMPPTLSGIRQTLPVLLPGDKKG